MPAPRRHAYLGEPAKSRGRVSRLPMQERIAGRARIDHGLVGQKLQKPRKPESHLSNGRSIKTKSEGPSSIACQGSSTTATYATRCASRATRVCRPWPAKRLSDSIFAGECLGCSRQMNRMAWSFQRDCEVLHRLTEEGQDQVSHLGWGSQTFPCALGHVITSESIQPERLQATARVCRAWLPKTCHDILPKTSCRECSSLSSGQRNGHKRKTPMHKCCNGCLHNDAVTNHDT